MGRNRRHLAGRRGNKLKASVGIGAAVVVGGGAIGAVAVASASHPAVTTAASAGYSRSYSHAGNQGNILNAALADYSWSHARAFTQFARLANTRSETEMWHGRTKLAFERGRVVLATKQFVLIRAANGTFNVWFLSHGTKVTNVATSQAGTTALTGSRPAATAAMAGQMTAATATVSGSTAAAQKVLAPTATTVSVNIAGTGVTVSVTVTSNMATVAAGPDEVAAARHHFSNRAAARRTGVHRRHPGRPDPARQGRADREGGHDPRTHRDAEHHRRTDQHTDGGRHPDALRDHQRVPRNRRYALLIR